MYFEAEANGIKYAINVREMRNQWRIGIKEDNKDWEFHNILKKDYQYMDDTISFIFNNSSYLVNVIGSDSEYTAYTRGVFRQVKISNEETLLHESLKSGKRLGSGDNLVAGMPGKIVKIMVKPGDTVKADEPLLIMEAMKMENEMRAATDVKIKDILVKTGDNVEGGATLITFEKP